MYFDQRAVAERVNPLPCRDAKVPRVHVTPDESVDGLLRNKVQVIQAKRGYRTSEDALILAWFVEIRPGELVLDVGTGSGAIAFGLAMREPTAGAVGLELQGALADRARRGALLNGLDARVSIVRGDARTADRLFRRGRFDVVVCNPPYHRAGQGFVNQEAEKAVARHQLMLPCRDLFRIASVLLRECGRLALIYQAQHLSDMVKPMKDAGLGPSRVLWIQARKESSPGLVCVEARLGADFGSPTEEWLILYDDCGRRTPEATAILNGEDIQPPAQGGRYVNSIKVCDGP